jgi:hypothetical protein
MKNPRMAFLRGKDHRKGTQTAELPLRKPDELEENQDEWNSQRV